MRIVGHLVVVILRRVPLLQLLDGLLVLQPLALAQAGPETVARKNGLQQSSSRNREVPLDVFGVRTFAKLVTTKY